MHSGSRPGRRPQRSVLAGRRGLLPADRAMPVFEAASVLEIIRRQVEEHAGAAVEARSAGRLLPSWSRCSWRAWRKSPATARKARPTGRAPGAMHAARTVDRGRCRALVEPVSAGAGSAGGERGDQAIDLGDRRLLDDAAERRGAAVQVARSRRQVPNRPARLLIRRSRFSVRIWPLRCRCSRASTADVSAWHDDDRRCGAGRC